MNELSRKKIILRTSSMNIVTNVVIAVLKIVIGVLVSSYAIMSEGIHNATDALNSVLTFAGTKLAAKHPDTKHPFGYGRIEYLTALAVAIAILFTGVEIFIGAIDLFNNPVTPEVSYISIIIVAATAIVKFILGLYTMKQGKSVSSGSLTGVGIECRNDAFASIVTIASSVVFLFSGYSIDAFAGIFTSVIIIKGGIDILRITVSDLIGRSGDKQLADDLYKEIRGTDGIINAADMMLHNYGPGKYSGSVNVEIDHKKTVGEIYSFLHELQLKIMHEKNVTMVFGVYAVDDDHAGIHELRTYIADFVKTHEHVTGYHAVYFEPVTGKIFCDLTVDYELRDWDKQEKEFKKYLNKKYPGHEIELVTETEYV